jgi:hypothetical protein
VSGSDVAVLVFGIGLTAALPVAALVLRRHPEPRAAGKDRLEEPSHQ